MFITHLLPISGGFFSFTAPSEMRPADAGDCDRPKAVRYADARNDARSQPPAGLGRAIPTHSEDPECRIPGPASPIVLKKFSLEPRR